MGKGQLVKAMLPFKPLDDFLTEQLGIDAKADQRGMAIGLENRVSYNKLRHRNQVSWTGMRLQTSRLANLDILRKETVNE